MVDGVVDGVVVVDVVTIITLLTVSVVALSVTFDSTVTFFTTGKRDNGYGQQCE